MPGRSSTSSLSTGGLHRNGILPASSKARIVFAISRDDRERFLRGQNLRAPFLSGMTWVDVSQLTLAQWEKRLLELDPEILVVAWDTPALPEAYRSREDLALRYICHLTGGVKPIVSRGMLERGIVVTNWGAAISHTIAEHALLLTLGALRNLPSWPHMMNLPADRITQLRTRSLRGSRVGLHGFGGIAQEIVRLLAPFQTKISAYSKGVPRNAFLKHGVQPCSSLAKLFSTSDILIECEALTPRTRGCVTGRILARLPQDAVFVNVGRGAVVDEAALINLAERGHLRVALDVFSHEPLPLDSPFFRLPGVLLSPHIAGPTWDASPLCGEFALANLRRYLKGEPLQSVVTLEIYDRTT
jgi:phosphoglycerate dehydrogenase-like enzyme